MGERLCLEAGQFMCPGCSHAGPFGKRGAEQEADWLRQLLSGKEASYPVCIGEQRLPRRPSHQAEGTPVLALWEPLTDSLPWPFPRLHILNSQILFLGKQNSAFLSQGDLDQTSEMPQPTPFQLALGYFLSLN